MAGGGDGSEDGTRAVGQGQKCRSVGREWQRPPLLPPGRLDGASFPFPSRQVRAGTLQENPAATAGAPHRSALHRPHALAMWATHGWCLFVSSHASPTAKRPRGGSQSASRLVRVNIRHPGHACSGTRVGSNALDLLLAGRGASLFYPLPVLQGRWAPSSSAILGAASRGGNRQGGWSSKTPPPPFPSPPASPWKYGPWRRRGRKTLTERNEGRRVAGTGCRYGGYLVRRSKFAFVGPDGAIPDGGPPAREGCRGFLIACAGGRQETGKRGEVALTDGAQLGRGSGYTGTQQPGGENGTHGNSAQLAPVCSRSWPATLLLPEPTGGEGADRDDDALFPLPSPPPRRGSGRFGPAFQAFPSGSRFAAVGTLCGA